MYAADYSSELEGYEASRSTALVKKVFRLESDRVDEGIGHKANSNYHICKYCKRQFLSGRALGGHMRAHGSLSLEVEADAAADWHANHQQVADDQIQHHEILEQLSSSGGDGDSRAAFRNCFIDADRNLHGLSDSTSQPLVYSRIKLDFKGFKIMKEIAKDDVDAAGGTKYYHDHGYNDGEEEADEDASLKASATSTTYSNVLEDGEDGNGDHNVHESELENEKSKAGGSFYALRKNRKPSKRLHVDPENYAMGSANSPKKITASTSLDKNSHECSECGKQFVSWKALFGHMRCHPEREWRGIQRPVWQDSEQQAADTNSFLVVANRSCKVKKMSFDPHKLDIKYDCVIKPVMQAMSDESDAESIEAAYMNGKGKHDALQSWITGKRSKRSRQVVRSLRAVTDRSYTSVEVAGQKFRATSEMKVEDADMADCLVMLACASSWSQKGYNSSRLNNSTTRTMSISSNDLDRRSEGGDTAVRKELLMDIDVRPNYWLHKKDPSRITVDDICADDGSLCQGLDEEDRRGNETRRTDMHPGSARYECFTCKRLFKSHQALGGHRASHKKVKGCFARTYTHPSDDEDIFDSQKEGVTDLDLQSYSHELECQRASGKKDQEHELICRDGENEKETVSYHSTKLHARVKRHECSICHRVFSSGQALGGHKRCHWGGDGSSATSVDPNSSTSKQPATVVHLDLNLPAPEEYGEFSVDYKRSPTYTRNMKMLITKSISDENIMPQKSPGEFNSSVNDSQRI